MGNDLGFGKASNARREALDLSDLGTPSSARDDSRTEEKVFDSAAERAGFTSREPTERVVRTRKAKEPTDQIFVRARISVINRFKQHCNENELSYGELIEELMTKAGI